MCSCCCTFYLGTQFRPSQRLQWRKTTISSLVHSKNKIISKLKITIVTLGITITKAPLMMWASGANVHVKKKCFIRSRSIRTCELQPAKVECVNSTTMPLGEPLPKKLFLSKDNAKMHQRRCIVSGGKSSILINLFFV